jgi:sugar phosphate isomerase/epimerase
MARPIILYSGTWADRPLDELAGNAAEWGYAGLELVCWGDHFEVQRALGEEEYCAARIALCQRHELTAGVPVLSCHRVSQAVCDPIDSRHRDLLPDYVWGNGQPQEVQQRAAEEVLATARAAQKLGVPVLAGFSGSPVWSYVAGYPGPKPGVIADALRTFAHAFGPILDACQECGLRYALEVHPGQIAFDLYSAEMVLDAVGGRPELGFLFDPSHLHWQGVDPAAFVRRFPERIYHVHIKDAVVTLDGRSGLLGGYLPPGDPRQGWHFRSPGRGAIDWEAVIRALNDAGYDGPLSVEWKDAGMERDSGAEEACKFVKRLDFERPRREGDAFR